MINLPVKRVLSFHQRNLFNMLCDRHFAISVRVLQAPLRTPFSSQSATDSSRGFGKGMKGRAITLLIGNSSTFHSLDRIGQNGGCPKWSLPLRTPFNRWADSRCWASIPFYSSCLTASSIKSLQLYRSWGLWGS